MRRETILLVEDDPDEIQLMQKALEKAGLPNPLQILRNGADVVPYFEGKGEYADRAAHPLPGLVFLDLRLPGVSGLHLLAWIKGRPEFRHIPVVIFTASERREDMEQAYRFGANSYLVKPLGFGDFIEMLKLTGAYWIRLNSTPSSLPERKRASTTRKPRTPDVIET